MPSLRDLGLSGDALSDPLIYPGKVPEQSALLLNDELLWLVPQARRQLGQFRVELEDVDLAGFPNVASDNVALNVALLAANAAPVDARCPVVAIGSNASPAQLTAKFHKQAVSRTVPMTRATLRGIAVGHSAHVSAPGYIAATPLDLPDALSKVTVLWLDRSQLSALDATERNYHRIVLDGKSFPLELESSEQLNQFAIYVSRWGFLVNPDGLPYPLTSQRQLFNLLRQRSGHIAELLGQDPLAFAHAAAADIGLRDKVREAFVELDWAREPGLPSKRLDLDGRAA